jgi:transposase
VKQLYPKDARTLTTEELYDLRKRAVTAVRSGHSYIDVASVFGLSRQAVARWAKSAKIEGACALKPKQKGRPTGSVLGKAQSLRILKSIVHNLPDQLGLPFFLWTREAVASLVYKFFRRRLSVWSIGRLLKSWGLTPQKPIRRAYERDASSVKKWLQKEYPKIKALARREGAIILWEDETGLSSEASINKTYAPKEKTPIVSVSGTRFRCNMIAGINNRGKLFFMVFTSPFTSFVFIIFLKRLLRQVRRKIFLIADKHPVHRSGETKKWLLANEQKIKIYFLPPYSPELNPSEYLNQDVKTNTIRKERPKDIAQMIKNLRRYLRNKQRKPEKVKAYFKAEPVRYAL